MVSRCVVVFSQVEWLGRYSVVPAPGTEIPGSLEKERRNDQVVVK